MVRTWHLVFAFGLLAAAPASAVRVKDIGSFHGVRSNRISGAGLVVGLQRSGDSRRNEAAIQSLAARLKGVGASLETDQLISRNVALVMVSANLDAYARTGGMVDVTVASAGDATSLEGGYLLLTPLFGPDGQVYAAAEGPLVLGGFAVESAGSEARKNITTVGRVMQGATIEREVASAIDLSKLEGVDFVLHSPDFTTAERLATAVDAAFGADVADARTPSTIHVAVPTAFRGQFPRFAAKVEAVEVAVDTPARVVVNERTGTIVLGADVQLSAVAVAHGGLTIQVERRLAASQPGMLSGGTTALVQNTSVQAEEAEGKLTMLEGSSVGALVDALNDLGVKPRDLVSILQALREAGALHAEVVTL